MSSFPGPLGLYMKCFEGISVDHFGGPNLKSSAFFLSHFHVDHMLGLDKMAFLHCLQNRSDVKLYMTDITRRLLLRERDATGHLIYNHLSPYIASLPMNTTSEIFVPAANETAAFKVRVALFDAYHCIGSAMFLFEREMDCTRRLLYTGDIRLAATNFCADAMPDLFHENGNLKSIDVLCIDTTFCCLQATYIPTYDQSLKCLRQFVQHFLLENRANRILFNLPAKIGHEALLECCVQALGGAAKVHASPAMFNRYLAIPTFSNNLTEHDESVQVHACCDFKASLSLMASSPDRLWWCPHGLPFDSADDRLAIVRPSIMHFADDKIGPDKVFYRDPVPPAGARHRTYHICYSAHSSFDELRSIVVALRPKLIVPNVSPRNSSLREARQLLEESMAMVFSVAPSIAESLKLTEKEETFINWPTKRKINQTNVSDDASLPDLDFTPDNIACVPLARSKKGARSRHKLQSTAAVKRTTKESDVISVSSGDEDDR